MKIDMSKEWLRASKLDLESVKYIIEAEHLTPIVAFHSQQSIEKSFKAIIEYQNKRIPKQHDLLKLKKNIENFLDIEEKDNDTLDILNKLYIDSRYPSSFGLLPYGKPTIEDAKEFYKLAIEIFDKTCSLLGIDNKELL